MNWEIYTDGSSKGNGKSNANGGWAYYAVRDNLHISKSGNQTNTTNQRMELMAAIQALENCSGYFDPIDSITIISDSAYLINCYKQRWWMGWEINGWKNSKKQPVANQDLWERLIPWFKDVRVNWEKVKGHSGITEREKYNEYVDSMAQAAAEELKK